MPYSGGESLEQKFIWVQRSCFFLHATLVACSDIEDSLGFKCQTGYSRAPWPVFSFFSSSTHDFSSRQWNDLWYLKQWRVFHSNYWTKNCLFPGYVFLFCFGLLLSRYWEILRAGGEWGNRWRDGWVVSLTQLVWVWANSGDGEGQESLVCCSPQGCKELDITEQWTMHCCPVTLNKAFCLTISAAIYGCFHSWCSCQMMQQRRALPLLRPLTTALWSFLTLNRHDTSYFSHYWERVIENVPWQRNELGRKKISLSLYL